MSFDWFLDQRSNGGSNIIKLYYQKMIMYTALPLLMAICSAIFWTLYFWFKMKGDLVKKNGRIVATVNTISGGWINLALTKLLLISILKFAC